MVSVRPYKKTSVVFASQAAMDIIIELKGADARRRMLELLDSCSGNPLTAALCGYLFEEYSLGKLEQGGRFNCRSLCKDKKHKATETVIEIWPSKRKVVKNVSSSQSERQLHVPRSKRYPGIDAWIHHIGAFQITISNKHSINPSVETDLSLLGKGANRLYWVLPPQQYSSFKPQKSQGFECEQWALLMDYP